MDVTPQILFAIQDFSPKKETTSLGALVQKYSEYASLHSDTPILLRLKGEMSNAIRHPSDALTCILCISLLRGGWSSYYQIEGLVRDLSNTARRYCYEGGWRRVGEILSSTDFYRQGMQQTFQVALQDKSTEDFFGNILPHIYRWIKNNVLVFKEVSVYEDPDIVKQDIFYRKPKRKIRRRGYNDKGTLKPSHKWLPGTGDLTEEEYLRRQEEFAKYKPKEPPARYWFGVFQALDKKGIGPGGSSNCNTLTTTTIWEEKILWN